MKTKEELNAIKEEFENLNKKFEELSEEELKQVVGGVSPPLTMQQAALISIISTRTVSLIGLDGKPIGNPSPTPLEEVVK